jgi:hypothetical protein
MTPLEQRIKEKIQQDEMFPGHNRIYLEAQRIEIEIELGTEGDFARNKKTRPREIKKRNMFRNTYFPLHSTFRGSILDKAKIQQCQLRSTKMSRPTLFVILISNGLISLHSPHGVLISIIS